MKKLLKILPLLIIGLLAFPSLATMQVSGSLWKLQSNELNPVNSSWSLQIPGLGGSGTVTPCVTNTGDFTISGCPSGSGTVTQINTTFPILGGPITTTGTLTFGGLSTSTSLILGELPYSTGVNTFGQVATTTASCAGTASCSSFTVIGTTPVTISATGGSGGSGTVGTSTNEQQGFLPYWTTNSATPALLGKVATTSLGVSAPLSFSGTLGAQVGGASGNFTCTTASAGVTGCLSGTDWSTFNNKGSGTVTSVGLSDANSTLTIGSTPVTTSGTITATLNLGHTNSWSVLQNFTNASTSLQSIFQELFVGGTSTTTIFGNGATSTFMGSLVIATTSPNAFVIQDQYNTQDALFNTASTTGSIFTVAATTSPNLGSGVIKLFDVDQYGHLTASSTPATPTISSCGSGSPAMGANANDDTGTFVTGTSASACTITFGRAYATTPVVVVSDSNTSAVVDVSAVSTTAFTVSLASALSSVTVYYIVVQP